MYKKTITWVIILTFLLSTIFPVIPSVKISSNKIIYVDDDNTEGPWNGTLEHPYNNIQDAVDNASNYNWVKIFIFNGIYESVIIYEPYPSMDLEGESKDFTIIDGNQNSIGLNIISEKTFYIYNLTLKNCRIGIRTYANYTRVENCNINNNDYGIDIHGELDINTCNIQSNNIGIRVGTSSYIGYNSIIENEIGIYVVGGIQVEYNSIIENEIGIYVIGMGFNADVEFNEIDNNEYGIIAECARIAIIKNYINHSKETGILFKGSYGNLIEKNMIFDNSRGIYLTFLYGALTIIKSKNNFISTNNFINNDIHATFDCRNNNWDENYWDDWVGLLGGFRERFPYAITGWFSPIIPFPWWNFDMRPAKEPYNINSNAIFT
ncbi:MAG: right-handed parallel beta-helix repeat-containing protein [Thermoplasmatales archaeon]|nr:MAG: right-handed parallel beta-helix repeat-containing protein [Thermoplasmatales archaeon]